uniref:60S ribosomal protein L10P insertion domain-containing protein n=1 Tax=Vitis vinifera TaxID=29760 RepID=A5ATY6_VITVI|nr:hypothetical protein VITISV_008840 [Vitis vinifera]
MMKHSTRLRAEKTGNPVFLNLVPLLVGNVGLISTKGDLKEVDKEVAKYKVGVPARAGLVSHIDVIVPPGNTGLDLAHTRASIKPISPTFSQPLHQAPITRDNVKRSVAVQAVAVHTRDAATPLISSSVVAA